MNTGFKMQTKSYNERDIIVQKMMMTTDKNCFDVIFGSFILLNAILPLIFLEFGFDLTAFRRQGRLDFNVCLQWESKIKL